MKKSIKILISVIVALIALWVIIFFIDYSRCSNFKEPIFVKAEETGAWPLTAFPGFGIPNIFGVPMASFTAKW